MSLFNQRTKMINNNQRTGVKLCRLIHNCIDSAAIYRIKKKIKFERQRYKNTTRDIFIRPAKLKATIT